MDLHFTTHLVHSPLELFLSLSPISGCREKTNNSCLEFYCHFERSREALKIARFNGVSTWPVLSEVERLGLTNGYHLL